jgi:alcohol dehydrogenase (cytochrome c)
MTPKRIRSIGVPGTRLRTTTATIAPATIFEAATGKIVWEFPLQSSLHGPVLSTITGLVFSGTAEGDFFALDAKTGKALWQFRGGGAFYGGPVSYMVDGKQQIAVAIGNSLFTFGL